MLRLTWYGDDFTGASDTLATLSAAGLRALLFPRAPTAPEIERAGPLDALGIAGTARALAPDEQAAELAPVARCFEALNAPLTLYKCCSTFDSAPQVGNLVRGARALRHAGHQPWLPIVGGQPGLGRFCAFGELYATAGAGGEVHRIDRHPTMSRHPVTPMHEADLRRHLALQGLAHATLIDLRLLDGASDGALDAALRARLQASAEAVLFDTTREEHLARIGRLLWQAACVQPLLALGASSVAQALIAHWRTQGHASAAPPSVVPADGPVFLMVGSLSPVTAAQVREGAHGYARVALPAHAMVQEAGTVEVLAQRCAALLAEGHSVLAQTADTPGAEAAAADTAQACAQLLKRVLALAPQARRVGVAGGDTSSFALRALNPWALRWAGSLAPGVPLLSLLADDPSLEGREIMLKGGQMGPPDVFQRLLHGQPA